MNLKLTVLTSGMLNTLKEEAECQNNINDREAFGALSNEAKGRYGGMMTRNKSNKVAPYVVGGLAATAAAPFAIGETAPFIVDAAIPAIGRAATKAFESTVGKAADAFAESSFGQKAIPIFNKYLSKPLNATFAADGVKEFVGPNGFQKTANHIANGEYGDAALSGIGDAVNLGLTALGGAELMDIGRGVVNGVNYFKNANFDNNMADFFHVLQMNNSWDAAAKAFNKYGKALVPSALIYPLYKNNTSNETN